MSMKNFYLSAKLFVSLCLAGFTSTAYAQNGTPRAAKPMGEVATEQTTVELLDDPFFYSFDNGKPVHWVTAGTVTQLKAGDRYSSDTGFGVGIETAANVEGCLKQVIDLKRTGKEVVQGDELECLVHYSTIESKRKEGPFRLALCWLDAAGNELISTEKDLKLVIYLVSDAYYKHPKFHFNKKAAYAFASRFYLMKGDWKAVIAYSDYVLGGDPKRMLRPWRQYANELEFNHKNLFRRYNSTDEPANLLMTTTESRLARTTPTEKYGSTFETVDKVFAKTGIEGARDYEKMNFIGTYIFTSSLAPVTTGRYLAKFDELSNVESTGSKPRGLYVTNVLFSVDEVLLNRMEAYAMLRDYNHAIDDYLQYMQGKFGFFPSVERSVYTSTNSNNYNIYTPFYGLTLKQLAMVKLFLDFRRKEFYQEGLRWFDIRRFHLAVKRSSKSSYYFPLEKDDPRKVLQIPAEAIQRGLAPNPRERNEPLR